MNTLTVGKTRVHVAHGQPHASGKGFKGFDCTFLCSNIKWLTTEGGQAERDSEVGLSLAAAAAALSIGTS